MRISSVSSAMIDTTQAFARQLVRLESFCRFNFVEKSNSFAELHFCKASVFNKGSAKAFTPRPHHEFWQEVDTAR
jgi:hypothetical protein